MATTGRTGADAFFKTLIKQAHLMASYGPKLTLLVQTMEGLGLLTAAEAALVNAYFETMVGLAAVFAKMAEYSGFDPNL